jgi:hypothetical protein
MENAIQTSASRLARRSIAGTSALSVLCVVIAACSPATLTPSGPPAASAAPTQSSQSASPVTSSAPSAAASTPSATPASTSAAAACTPADIVATSGPLGGAAGSRGADITVSASGNGSCQLTASPVVALSDPSGKIVLTSHLPVGADGPIVSTAATFTFSFQLSNWCDETVATPIDVVFALGSGSLKVGGLSLTTADLPPCNGPGQPPILSTTEWTQH